MNDTASFRHVSIASWRVDVERSPDGTNYLRPSRPLAEYPLRLTDRLDEWAVREPSRVLLAQRDTRGEWRNVTYSEFRTAARAVAQALLDRGVSVERPVAVLSGNDIEHALIEVGAMYAGIPYSPLSPSWSLASKDFARLRDALRLLTPGLLFASDGAQFQKAIEAAVPKDAHLVVAKNQAAGPRAELFPALLAPRATPAVDHALARVTPDTVAKILFTSGSAGFPKGVINTHRMLCSNQEMLRTVFEVLAEEPPVICDWLPWHHTFGGNHNFGLVLYNGGTLYIDGGRPTPGAFDQTVQNLRDISPTIYFNVPKGYEMLVEQLRADALLRERFFARLKMTFYAAASLPQRTWDDLDDIALKHCGLRIRMLTGLGMTETSPFAISASTGTARAGYIGLPAPGVEVKLAPVEGKLEVRYRGPNVTPGFWRQEELTRAAFDEERFFRSGDAAKFFNPGAPAEGLVFDGRLAEDFKLSTGTWVSAGPLRMRFLAHCAPYIKDAVIAGHDRDEITALIFPDGEACPGLDELAAKIQQLLGSFADAATGSSNRIERVVILVDPPSADAGEITDKGSINQRAVLARRADLVNDLYRRPLPGHVLCARSTLRAADR
ncbi:MAG TPA: feruloyl-CoA synthase [Candidatus Acidoferrum sp.]|jgi:feruloyl-CoA synthase|nr:feruloyl-CoA synthase [Candidatus Acidoferrum sp.]